MIILDATTKSLELLLSGNVTTNQLPVVASFVDVTPTTYVPGESDTASNNTSVVTVVAAPAASTQRQVKFLSVYNADTVVATVTVRYNDNATTRILVKFALAVNSTLQYTDGEGWRVIDTTGSALIASTATGSAGGDLTGTYPNPTIAANKVTDADIRQSSGLSVIGRSANTTGNVADITGTDGQVLRVAGTALGFGTVVAAGLASDAVTTVKILDANVTLAKIANAAASSKLVGSGASGSGAAYVEITLGTGLTMTGTTLSGSAGSTAAPRNPEGRLTLTTGTPVTSTDVATATSIFYTPYVGNIVWTYDSSVWTEHVFTERTLALGTLTSGKNYDVFIYNNAGTMTLVFSAAWTSDSARADALAYQDGVLVLSSDHSRRYLGTFRTISTTQTADTQTKRFVWNMYNRRPRSLVVRDTTDTWVYNTATWRQANNSTANQVEVICGQAEDAIDLRVAALAQQATAANSIAVNIAEDSTTVPNATNGTVCKLVVGVNILVCAIAFFSKIPVLGYHKYCWLEWANTTVTTTFHGDNAVTEEQSGMLGTWSA